MSSSQPEPLPPFVRDLSKRQPELSETLIQWANTNSGSENTAGLDRMVALLSAAFRSLPGEQRTTRVRPDGPAVFQQTCRPDAPIQVLLNGHYDTVYGANHPFQTCTWLNADTLNGPGVADMKGGLVILLATLQAFEHSPEAAQIGWEVLLTPDEETGSQGTAPFLAEAALRHLLGLVFEPCRDNGYLVQSRKGTGIFFLRCHGRAAHAGRDPREGRNAVVALASIIPALHELPTKLPGVMVNVARIRGGTAANIVPDFAELEINLRTTVASDAPAALAKIEELIAPINQREGYRIELTGSFNRPPKEATAQEERLFRELQVCGKALGLEFGWQHVGGGSDGNLLHAAGLNNLDGLGILGGHLHSPSEFAWVPSLVQRAQLSALFLHRIASGEIRL